MLSEHSEYLICWLSFFALPSCMHAHMHTYAPLLYTCLHVGSLLGELGSWLQHWFAAILGRQEDEP